MKQLLEDYQRRLVTINKMLDGCSDAIQIERLSIKASCYRAFIAELERELSKIEHN